MVCTSLSALPIKLFLDHIFWYFGNCTTLDYKKFMIKSTPDCPGGRSVMVSISRPAVSDRAAVVSHQSKLTASSSIQDGHQLKPVELNIVLWYIYILKLDLIIPGAESFHSGPPPLNAHTPLASIKIWMGHKRQS